MGLAPLKINVSLESRPSPPPYKLTGKTSNRFNPPVKINVPMSLVSAKHRSINTNPPSPENEVVHDVAVADAPLQPPIFIFVLTDVSIQIFDPGGKLAIVVGSIARRHQIQSLSSAAFIFRSSGIIFFISDPCSFCSFTPVRFIISPITVFDPGGDQSIPAENSGGSRRNFSLLRQPWDRGKKSCGEAVCRAVWDEEYSNGRIG
ncbi:hypothetical protein P8452_39234 [Trifolium repens]|nr:hypothetical protein P8452_39234 [Trifolium repens]